ncbi:MAG: LysR family transcriptional regulator [Beijerinckiaceae bacterium]
MHLDLNGLQAFAAIAERGSFRAAAAHLNLTQTALSHRMRKFEESTGVQLLARTTRQVSLTAAGAELLPRARRILDEMAAAMERMHVLSQRVEPKLAFGCLPTIAMVCLPAIMTSFRRTYPDVAIRVFDSSASEIADKVQAGDADFGVTVITSNRWNLDQKPLVEEPFVLLCRTDDRLAGKHQLDWAEIVDLPLVRISAETGNRILIDDALGLRKENLNWRYEVQRVTTAVALVGAGAGYAVLPRLAMRTLDDNTLATVPLTGPTVLRTLGVVTRKMHELAPAASHMLDLIAAGLRHEIGTSQIYE